MESSARCPQCGHRFIVRVSIPSNITNDSAQAINKAMDVALLKARLEVLCQLTKHGCNVRPTEIDL